MRKEPTILYIFRFVMNLSILAFLGMLYWSSVVREERLGRLQKDFANLEEQVEDLQGWIRRGFREQSQSTKKIQEKQQQLNRSLEEIKGGIQEGARFPHEYKEEEETDSMDLATPLLTSNQHTQVNPELPNLLQGDPFYSKTLPSLLPADFLPHGTRHGAVVGKPDNLHPFAAWSSVQGWWDLCSLSVAKLQFGKYETLTPDMAFKLEERSLEDGGMEFWVHLRDQVYWLPLDPSHFPNDLELAPHFLERHQVTAHDFKFYFDVLMNPHVQEAGAVASRTYFRDIEDLRVVDDLTFVVRWKQEGEGEKKRVKYSAKGLTGGLKPLPRWVYQYLPDGSKIVEEEEKETYRTNSVWAQNFSQHWAKNIIVSCGPWKFAGMTDESIRFERNADHYDEQAVLVDEQVLQFRESPDSLWQDFKAGKTDLYTVRPDQLNELDDFLSSEEYAKQEAAGKGIQRLDYVSRSYSYIGWNQAKPYFKSAKVRKALTMAIDRQRIIDQTLQRMGIEITGPFYRYSPSYNEALSPYPFDLQKARALLEEEGWYDSDGDGIRDKEIDGIRIPFSFTMTYFVKNPSTKAICEYVATALREIGVDCQLSGVDIADLSKVWDEKSFDALVLGWALGTPPEDPRQLWHSSGASQQGSSNGIGFQNKEADQIIEALQYEYDEESRKRLYHRFHEIIHEEAPYTFLYTPKTALLYRNYVKNLFLPSERQDLIPGATVAEPMTQVIWLDNGAEP